MVTKYVDWKLSGVKLAACNCDYGCPCEFNARPTNGHCEGIEAMHIIEGYFGDVRLDGLKFAARFAWPGAVHEGRGNCQAVIDINATDAQRDALFKILSGEEQVPTTLFNIYGATMENELDPVFAEIGFECDIEAATGTMTVPGLMSAEFAPIKNPVTGADHRAQIRLGTAFEFQAAEMASATFTAVGPEMGMSHAKVYGALVDIAYGPYGIIEDRLNVAPVPVRAHAA